MKEGLNGWSIFGNDGKGKEHDIQLLIDNVKDYEKLLSYLKKEVGKSSSMYTDLDKKIKDIKFEFKQFGKTKKYDHLENIKHICDCIESDENYSEILDSGNI